MVFIVGMERCFTTSLAQWMIDSRICDYFVDGIKEPSMFSSEPARALARWERERRATDRWLLDASVSNAGSDEAFDAIHSIDDYRIVLSLRDQFERMVSAFRIYRALYGMDFHEAWNHPASHWKLGNAATRERLKNDSLAPATLTPRAGARHIFTHVRLTEIPPREATAELARDCERAVEAMQARRLPARVVYEWQHWERTGAFPVLSIVGSSYFAPVLARLLARVDPRRVMVVTPAGATFAQGLRAAMERFLHVRAVDAGFGRLHGASTWCEEVPVPERATARRLVSTEFDRDTNMVLDILDRHPTVDTTLFDPSTLFRATG